MALPNIGIDWHKDDEKPEEKRIEENTSKNDAKSPLPKSFFPNFLPKIEFKVQDTPKEAASLKERKEKSTNKTKQIIVWFTVLILVGNTIGPISSTKSIRFAENLFSIRSKCRRDC